MSTLTNPESSSWWRRLSGPLKIGIGAAGLGVALAIVGVVRGNVPLNPLSILLALLISGGSWGLVAWAIATAARDVDDDLAAAEIELQSEETTPGTGVESQAKGDPDLPA